MSWEEMFMKLFFFFNQLTDRLLSIALYHFLEVLEIWML